MSVDPTGLPPASTRLPLAWLGNASCAMPVTSSGYATPVSTVSTTSMRSAGRKGVNMSFSLSGEVRGREQQVDRLDADEWQQHAAHAVDQHVPAQDRRSADR